MADTTEHYILELYVAGSTPRSTSALNVIKHFCKDRLEGRYELVVIDIYQQPDLAERAQVVAAPTLIRRLPPPLRRFIGDLSDAEKVLVGVELKPKRDAS